MKVKATVAFFRLIRWRNLVFIALTQWLFYYCILLPSFYNADPPRENILKSDEFLLLCISSVLIAAAGYIINDYFDLHIDRVNRPEKIVVEKIIKRRWAIIWHWVLSGLGIAIGFYLSWKLRNIFIGPANLVCVLLLWFYSTTFKKKLLLGNVLISLLTAWVILVLYLCEFRFHRFVNPEFHGALSRVYKFAIVYASFAFIISLVREVVKDMEDLEGDARYGRRTMPVVWGINASKLFVSTWLLLLLAALIIIQFYVLQYRWWMSIIFSAFLIILPILWILNKLRRANQPADFRRLSSMIKTVMMMGILSMIFLKMYTSWIG
ncbi:MAG: geranylgeranylglycerol-phosphate geranylgeranyltransferase [Bacteroidota bacterium]|nr:geranylgeranylglycerol-phosphate geranylgeranyltransferase [Bacteroidota bacterium]MDP4213501.1 geranylgeranylglycerol-phosphate geranylgeranyltransferase [Bacteroidota bacterium]MDP4252095.1 geranylgeranylglycerol-phosphate geranylgeranyltransferase [Bacteroidota bacterium]